MVRFTFCSDCRYYLQMARSWESLHPTAMNAVWSPLYPWLLEALDSWIRPRPGYEGYVTVLAHLLCFLLAMGAFFVFWRRLSLSGPLIGVGWGLCLWSCLHIMQIYDNPMDRLAAVLIYVCAALLTALKERIRWWIFLLLGWAAALAYLAKAAQFLIAFAFFAAALWIVRRSMRWVLAGGVLMGLAFFSLAFPWIYSLSKSRGRWTYSDIGMIFHAMEVEGAPGDWNGDPIHGASQEPYVVLNEQPRIFAARIDSISNYWFDPSREFTGFRHHLELGRQISLIAQEIHPLLFEVLLHRRMLGWLGGFAILISMNGFRPTQGYLFIPALFTISLYMLIRVEARYLAPYLVMIAGAVLAGLRPSVAQNPRWQERTAFAFMGLFLLVWTVRDTLTFLTPPL